MSQTKKIEKKKWKYKIVPYENPFTFKENLKLNLIVLRPFINGGKSKLSPILKKKDLGIGGFKDKYKTVK